MEPKSLMKEQQIMLQLQQLPDDLQQEVLDFIGYLLAKYKLAGLKQPSPPQLMNGKKPGFGCGRVKVALAPDFDEPLEDFNEYME
jgi:hypothetical protein